MRKLLIIFSLFIAFSSCSEEDLVPEVTTDPELATELKASPERISVGSTDLVLTAYLWRDFMPGARGDASLLNGVVRLATEDGAPVAPGTSLKKVFIVKGDDVWRSGQLEVRASQQGALEGVVRKGPAWEFGSAVDVILEFEHNGQLFKLLAKGQRINATY